MEDREKEMLMRFIQQESDIKERWQIVEIFEEERKRFEEERKTLIEECERLDREYQEKTALVQQLQEQLSTLEMSFKEIERKEKESKELFKERETQSHQLQSENEELAEKVKKHKSDFKELSIGVESLKAEYIVRQNALNDIKKRRDSLLESAAESSLYEAIPLRQVEVIGRGGKVIKATPAKNYYEHTIISIQSEENRSEKELLEEIEKLQAKSIDLEIEKANMSIELRELKGELHILKNTLLTHKKHQPQSITTQVITHSTKPDESTKDTPIDLKIAHKISALGEPVEPSNFKQETDNEALEVLNEESFEQFKQPEQLEQHIEETQQTAEQPTPEETTPPIAEEKDLPKNTNTKKGNPFFNGNMRIITPKGFKKPNEVLD